MANKVFQTGKKSRTPSRKRKALTALAILVLLAGVGAALELTNTTHFFHKEKAVSGTIPTTQQISAAPTPTNGSTSPQAVTNNPSPTPTTSNKNTAISSSAGLLAPFGNFVSNHHPVLSNSDSTKEESSCNTTPGATCYISFTQGSTVRTLQSQTADSNGTVFWKWDVKQSGLTVGTWEISAIAKLGDQSKTSTDSLKMEIQP